MNNCIWVCGRCSSPKQKNSSTYDSQGGNPLRSIWELGHHQCKFPHIAKRHICLKCHFLSEKTAGISGWQVLAPATEEASTAQPSECVICPSISESDFSSQGQRVSVLEFIFIIYFNKKYGLWYIFKFYIHIWVRGFNFWIVILFWTP